MQEILFQEDRITNPMRLNIMKFILFFEDLFMNNFQALIKDPIESFRIKSALDQLIYAAKRLEIVYLTLP